MTKNEQRLKRKKRIRGKISGNARIPRVAIFRSNKNIYLQAIDDEKGLTLAAASTLKNPEPAAMLAEALKNQKIKRIVFDRGGYLYHGKVKEAAEILRKAGLEF